MEYVIKSRLFESQYKIELRKKLIKSLQEIKYIVSQKHTILEIKEDFWEMFNTKNKSH